MTENEARAMIREVASDINNVAEVVEAFSAKWESKRTTDDPFAVLDGTADCAALQAELSAAADRLENALARDSHR